ncbi:MAG: type II toxin-antitoxin system VapC family toxin [Nitrospirota bacterium]|nr:type II toxin-antitoxin system VapC family toxin [Nitrospirota bacterium]MDH5588245.1 type II toxin-antitoxin system VapC family toxin [Nitrospirota bacterium]
MIVSDTNLLIYLYISGQRTREAEAVLQKDPAWAAPLLWRSEFRNTLVGLERHKEIRMTEIFTILANVEQWMSGREYSVVSQQIIQLAKESGCSAYDCEFISVAKDLGVPLVTADRQVLRAFPQIAITPGAFLQA